MGSMVLFSHYVTRMHSSRMRTARSSGRPGGGLSTRQPPRSRPPALDTCCKACWDTTCNACWDSTLPPMETCCKACWDTTCNACWDSNPPGQNHRRLWKYNLAPTSLRALKIHEKDQRCRSQKTVTLTLKCKQGLTCGSALIWSVTEQTKRRDLRGRFLTDTDRYPSLSN